MIPDRLLNQIVTRARPVEASDSHGNTTRDYGPAADRYAFAAWLQQDNRDESFPDGRNPHEQIWLLLANEPDLASSDRIEWNHPQTGLLTFEVHGQPEPVYTPAGFHHIEAALRLLEG